MNFPTHDTAFIIDATKIKCWHTCPRKFFYNYILGWKLDKPEIHLFFGECFHLAMEYLMKNGLTDENAVVAFTYFMERWREEVEPMADDDWSPKNPSNAAQTLLDYVAHYASLDKFKVLHTEVAGSVPIDPNNMNRKLHFMMDVIAYSDEFGIFTMDHKTASYFDRNFDNQFIMDPQSDTYIHALDWAYREEYKIYGMIINGISVKPPLQMKKDGTPYANQKNRETFHRAYITKTNAYMGRWLENINIDFTNIEDNIDALTHCSPDDHSLKCFPEHTTNCVTKYGLCPYHNICKGFHNPLKYCESPPSGYKVDFWDPRKARKTAGKVIDL